MALLRRQPQAVVESPAPAPARAQPPAAERCRFCTGAIVVDPDHPTDLLVAMLLDDPGEGPYALAHRACAEKARGRRLPF